MTLVLVICANACQQEVVAAGKGVDSIETFYRKNSEWTDGFISAAKSIATSASYLVATADGLLLGSHKVEQLLVASNEVKPEFDQR